MALRKKRTDVIHCVCCHAKTLDVIIFGSRKDLVKSLGVDFTGYALSVSSVFFSATVKLDN